DAVEKRRLARAVRADHADDLAGVHCERHAIDGLDCAVRFANIHDAQEIRAARHRSVPLCAKRAGIDRMPPGSQIISATMAKPNTARYQFCMKRSHSGSSTMTTVPRMGPKNRPEPPTITASSIISEAEKWNGAGSTYWTSAAKNTPAMPAQAAPIANASSVYAVMLTPRLSARIGLSRSAANARPHGE